MEQIHQLEKSLVKWFSSAPHLPKNARNWLADNVWWMAALGVALSAFALIALLPMLFVSASLTSVLAPYGPADPLYGSGVGMAWAQVAFSIVSVAASLALLAMAINPLRAKAKHGWDLVFYSNLLTLALSVASAVIVFNVSNILSAVLFAVVGGYFLFEVRDHFTGAKAVAHKKAKKA